jgi:tetraacyldisaccharide 4'-kinase
MPYGWAVGFRNRFYDAGWLCSHQAPVPVVSVGNLTLGGTGKTPCVEYIARFYHGLGVRVAILSRGYGSRWGPNDEAQVLQENLPEVPHLQGADRFRLAASAVEELGSELLILDDGFQHRRLRRDLDLVLVDATAPWGCGHLFPRGPLREPPSSLRRAHLIVLTRCDQVGREERAALRKRLNQVALDIPQVETRHRPAEWVNSDGNELPLASLAGRPVAAFCGIGNPEAFRRTLAHLGAEVRAFRAFPDHHDYSAADVEDLRNWVRQQPTECLLATTQKDLVKIPLAHLGERELWALKIELQVEAGGEVLEGKLHGALKPAVCKPTGCHPWA